MRKTVPLKLCFFFFLGFWMKKNMPYGKRNSVKLSKCHLTCPENCFSRNNIKMQNVFLSRTSNKKEFAKTSWLSCQKCACTVQGNILRKSSSVNICFFFFLGNWKKKIMPFGKRNYAKLSKINFTCPKDRFSFKKNLNMHKYLAFAYLQHKIICENSLADLWKL